MNLRKTAIQVLNYDDAVNMMKKVDFEPLNKIVSEFIGIPVKFQYTVSEAKIGTHPRIDIFSETDVKENTGFLKNCFEKVLIKDFGANLFLVSEFDQDAIDACIANNDWSSVNKVPQTTVDSYLDLYLDARIYLKGGGENGLHILTGKFNFTTGKWNF